MKAKAADTVVKVVHDTIRITDTSSTYTEIKKGITDGLAESEREDAVRGYSSSSAQGIGDVLVPVVMFCILGYVISRNIEAKRATRLAMIERGMDPSFMDTKPSDRSKIFSSLRMGMFLAGIGIGLILGYVTTPAEEANSDLIIFAAGSIGGGLGFILYHYLARNKAKNDA